MSEIRSLDSGRIEVILDDITRQMCYKMAKARNYRRQGGNPGADRGGLDHVEANYIGILGEAAFALVHDLALSDVQVYRGYGDSGVDFDLGSGHRWQIKATRGFKRPILRLFDWEKRTADRFGLVAYRKPRTLHLIGWCFTPKIAQAPERETHDGQHFRMIDGSELAPFRGGQVLASGDVRAFVGSEEAEELKPIPEPSLRELEDRYPPEAEFPEWWEQNIARLLRGV